MLNNARTTLTTLALTGLLLSPAVGSAADDAGKYMVRGVGATKCQQLIATIDSKDENIRKQGALLYTSWLNGYLSHINRTEKDTYDVVPMVEGTHVLAVVAGQCRKNPDALMESLSGQVITLLAKAKVAKEGPLKTVTVGEMKGNFHTAVIFALQEKMIALGHLKGKADGDFGASSQKALALFQKAEKLKETGFPDPDTLMRALLK